MRSVSLCLALVLLGFSFPGPQAQTRTDAPYLLPQTIFVGDPGRLVVPLGQTFAGEEPFILEVPEKLPETPDLLIRRIELEHRSGSSRLLIDFIPYAPGILSLPALELSTFTLTGLEVQVASILSPSQMTLSEPASPLAVPGTSLLVNGTIVIIILLIFFGIGGSIWSRRHFRELWERFRRRHLLKGMTKFLKRLKQECDSEKKENPAIYLTRLSGEFRVFLSLFTGINCRSFTAGEFLELPLGHANFEPLGSGAFYLCSLFRNWDTLRFSGRELEMADLFGALNETEEFIIALEKAEKEKPLPKSAPGMNETVMQEAGL
jgi:hypothetical protein